MQYVTAVYGFTFFGAMLSFGLGTYLFTNALIDDIKEMLRKIDNRPKWKRSQTDVLKQLFEFIHFHSDVKKYSNNTFHFKSLHSITILTLTNFHLIWISIYCDQCVQLLQGSVSVDICSPVYVEFDHHLWCNVDGSNGNISSVKFKLRSSW